MHDLLVFAAGSDYIQNLADKDNHEVAMWFNGWQTDIRIHLAPLQVDTLAHS